MVDGEAVEGWRGQPGWCPREESSESTGYIELQVEVPGRVGGGPCPQYPSMVPMNESGSAPPEGTEVPLHSQTAFWEA